MSNDGFSRRELLTASAVGTALLAASEAKAAPAPEQGSVVVPNGAKLPWKKVGTAKVFHLVAEEVDHELAPGLKAKCWGYNGSVHGPLIEAVEGDLVRIYVTNKLPAPTTVHWHGLLVPNGMDGVAGVTQKAILPGETFKYEFPLKQAGTLMYHPHHDEMTQMALGMTGMFVIHPKVPKGPKVDRDFALMLHEWRIDPDTMRPDPMEMREFNVLTFNGKAYPGTGPLVVKRGERVRLRLGNLSAMDHHPIHIHGHQMTVVATDGGDLPTAGRWPETSVLVPVGTTRTVEFVADAPGDWPLHCHMTHHVMNQMGHGIPNMIGVDTQALDEKVRKLLPGYMSMGQAGMGDMGEMGMTVPANSLPMVGARGQYGYITMGGMFTTLKVREKVDAAYSDPGPFQPPPGTLATNATEADLKRDGIDVGPAPAPKPAEHHHHHG